MAMVLLISNVPELLQSSLISQILAIAAIALLVFVTVSVLYVSTVDRRDQQRRKSIKGKR